MRPRLSTSGSGFRYGLAVLGVAFAVVLRWWLLALVGEMPLFITFYPVVALVALFAGARAGVLTTVLSAITASYFFITPTFSLAIAEMHDAVAVGLFTTAGLVVSALAGRLDRARRREAEAAERERSREELAHAAAESERQRQLLAVTLGSIGDAVIVTDARGHITFINGEAQRLTGWSRAEAVGQSLEAVFRIVNEQTRRTVESPVEKVLRLGTVVGLANHTILIARDGREFPIDDSGAPIRQADGTVQGVVLVFRDFTERKAAEKRVERQARLLDLSNDAIFVWDFDGAIEYWNEGAETLYGYRRDEAVGRVSHELLATVHANGGVATFRAALERDGEWRGELSHTARDGRIVIVESRLQLVVQDGRRLVLETNRDITERKRAEKELRESEERFRTMANAIPQLAWVAQADGYIDWYNQRWYDYTGTTPAQMEGWGWQSVHDPDALPEVMEEWKASLATGAPFDMTFPLRGADGLFRPFLTRVMPLKDEQGRVQHWFGTNTDVSEQKRTEDALAAAKRSAEQAKEVAETASKAKDQFIAVLSHELRTPLTPAVAVLSMLRTDVRLPADVREDLDVVARNLDLEVRLIADLLDVSRIISGKLHLENRRVDVADAIREAANIVGSDLHAKGQTLIIEAPGSPYLAVADAARLQQVFWNLLRNAIKFSPERGRIDVRAVVVPVDHCPLAAPICPIGVGRCPLPQAGVSDGSICSGNLIVTVSDHGSGIAPEMLPRLFQAFEQGQQARSFGGLGLGLSICKAVVEMHGGMILAQSDGPGCGATFTVRLPVAQCPLSGSGTRPSLSGTPAGGGAAARKDNRRWKILLVEDHDDRRESYAGCLRPRGTR